MLEDIQTNMLKIDFLLDWSVQSSARFVLFAAAVVYILLGIAQAH